MNSNTKSVAIVGIACRFPGAKNYTEFWNNISSGVDNVQKIENPRWEHNKQYVKYKDFYGNDKFKWAALLDQIDEFDNEFFGISPKEASVMDPQQRLLLEESWHCIEDSGISLKELQTATTSVHIGVSAVDYQYHLCNLDRETTGYDTLGLYPCVLSNRLSYYLNLTGSSQSLDTACASSLVALHDAKETILQGKAKYSLVGGVVLMGYPWRYLSFIKANMLSPDGKCKTFDASADGFVPGEGVGVVLLESVEDALANNHHIYGVIKGSSVHHSGRSKVLTAPSISAQKRVITEALSENAVSPLTISYVEAHGTGTSLGDPIEVEALTQAFGTPEKQYCKIGSVKTNIGHLGAAAGMAGLIKVLLMMKNKVIPPSLNVKVVNPLIDFDNSPFQLANTLTPWELSDENALRRAGVSSFGFGGVNSHVVLEEYKEPKKQLLTENATGYPFVLSSKTQQSLKSQIVAWKKYIDTSEFKSQELKDISYTLTTGRYNFEERIALFAKDKDDLRAQILALDPEEIKNKNHKDQKLLLFLGPIQNAENEQENFKVLYTTIDRVIRSGFKPSCITGFGLAGIAGLVISGLLEYDEACKWIADQTTSIKLKRPHTPFYDIRSKKMFLPYTPSEKYLTELTDSLELDSTTQDQLCSHSKKLLSNQRTFTKLVEEWENLLKKFDLSIKDSLDSLRTLDKKQQLVISVGLLFCIKKLNLKWDLSDKIHVANDRMSEILDLLLDEVLLPDELTKFLLQPSALVKMTLVKDMETRIEKVRPTNPYKLLKSFSCDDVEYTDPHTWLSSIYTYTCDPETVKMPFAENQWRISVNDEWLKTFDKNLPSLLIAAWEKGVTVAWDKWFSFRDSKAIALPTYSFHGQRFWPDEAPIQDAPKEEILVEAKQKVMDLPKLIDVLAKGTPDGDAKQVQEFIKSIVRDLLSLESGAVISEDTGLFDLGLDSITGSELVQRIQESIGDAFIVRPTVVYDYPNISALSSYLIYNLKLEKVETELEKINLKYSAPIREERLVKKMHPIKLSNENIGHMIDHFVGQALGSENIQQYSRSIQLHEIGLQGQKLLTFQRLLTEAFKQEFRGGFFNKYSTAQSLIDYFINIQGSKYKNWLYDVEWTELSIPIPPTPLSTKESLWLIFADTCGIADELAEKLSLYDQKYLKIISGKEFLKPLDCQVTIRADVEEDFAALLQLPEMSHGVRGIIYSWGLYKDLPEEPLLKDLQYYHTHSCQGLLYLVKALSKTYKSSLPQLIVTTWGMQEEGGSILLAQWPISGFCKSISMEYPEFNVKRITLDINEKKKKIVDYLFLDLWASDKEDQVAWRDGKRYGPRLIREVIPETSFDVAKKDATYLIIGGFGFALKFIEWYAKKGAKHFAILSNQSLPEGFDKHIQKLKENNLEIRLYSDVALHDYPAMLSLISAIKHELPPIKGVLFFPTELKDISIEEMNWNDFSPLMDLKVGGAWNIHLLTKELNLDHFVLFSAVGSILDPKSSANRSTSNAFLDALSFYRKIHELPSLTINWGPFSNDDLVLKNIYESHVARGLRPLSSDDILNVLNHVINLKKSEIVVADINWDELLKHYMVERPLLTNMEQEIGIRKAEILTKFKFARLEERYLILKRYIRTKLRRILHLVPTEPLSEKKPFEEFGLDEQMSNELHNYIQYDISDAASLPRDLVLPSTTIDDLTNALYEILNRELYQTSVIASEVPSNDEPIAVIGLHCRLPGGAINPEEYWKVLVEGKEGVREIPPERWDIDSYYDPDPNKPGKMNTRKGGFIDNIDHFDADFFGISPAEAELMDPQQRLFLETCWIALERAGISPHSLKSSLTGVFVGVSNNDYGTLIMQQSSKNVLGLHFRTGNALSAISGRVSHILGLVGPSMIIDTACSSSLVSVYEACKSLQAGGCTLALAGGVNILLQPDIFVALSKGQMLSPDGYCKTFDASANGYARGEGVGVLVLKKLSDAVRDRDQILAVIAGGAVNQAGPSSGLTVPNGIGQQTLIKLALTQAKLNPSDISYIEAHGTGTSLGDPIEIGAIDEVYGKGRSNEDTLLLGSVKSNIGHLEAAAGIASLIKVILCLNRRELTPNIHFQKLNPKIDLTTIPAKIVLSPTNWSVKKGQKLRAGISSFGFTGTTAHIILEEAPSKLEPTPAKSHYLVTFSAKNNLALKMQLQQMLDWLKNHTENATLAEISYTLHAGRDHFAKRCAVVAGSKDELVASLAALVEDESTPNASSNFLKNTLSPPKTDADVQSILDSLSSEKQLEPDEYFKKLLVLADCYTAGLDINHQRLYENEQLQKIVLPTYPFQYKRYWSSSAVPAQQTISLGTHPLLGVKHSLPSGQYIFSNEIQLSKLPYLKDHQVYQYIVCPGATYYEMFVAVGKHLFELNNVKLVNISIDAPLKFIQGETTDTSVVISKQNDEVYKIEIFSNLNLDNTSDPIWERHAQAELILQELTQPELLDINSIKATCTDSVAVNNFYERRREVSLNYGEAFQALNMISFGKKQALGEITVKPSVEGYLHHPTLLDGCFQLVATTVWQMPGMEKNSNPFLPIGCAELLSFKPTGSHTYALWKVKEESPQGIVGDFTLFDENGNVTAEIHGMQYRKTTKEALESALSYDPLIKDLIYEWTWREQAQDALAPKSLQNHWLIFGDLEGYSQHVAEYIKNHSGTYHIISQDAHPKSKSEYIRVISQISQLAGKLNIVHLSSIEHINKNQQPSIESIRKGFDFGCKSFLFLIQALAELEKIESTPLYWITIGAESINNSVNLAQTCITAQHKSFALEFPEMKMKQIDLDPEAEQISNLRILESEIFDESEEQHIAYHESKRYVGKFLRKQIKPASSDSAYGLLQHPIDTKASYLITGATGGLGLIVADWLIKQGAKTIILTSRSAPNKEALEHIQGLANKGVSVIVEQCDVANKDHVEFMLNKIKNSPNPLKGIFHLAGVIDDGAAATMDWERYEKVFSPKVYGSFILHEATKQLEIPLEHFVVFSSRAASRGSWGQSNYAAANCFMDGLCYYRRMRGLPALSLAWGAWAEAGAAVGLVSQQVRRGLYPLKTSEALRCLEATMKSDIISVTIGKFDWEKLLSQFVKVPTWLSAFEQKRKGAETLTELLEKTEPSKYANLIYEFIKKEVGSILGLSEKQDIESNRNLFDMGFDSLMAVDLLNKIQMALGPKIRIGSTLIFDYPTISSITKHLSSLLGAEKAEGVVEKNIDESKSLKFIIINKPRPQAQYRLFAIPYAGGSAAWFQKWNDFLPESIELCALELPGRMSSPLPPTTDINKIIDLIMPEIATLTDKPYCIYAHSFGVCIAVELLIQMQKANIRLPNQLIVSSRGSPSTPMKNPIHQLSDEEFIRGMSTKYRAIPPAIVQNKDLLNRLLPLLRADITIHESYLIDPNWVIPVPVTVMGGKEDHSVSEETLATWEAISVNGFTLRVFPGGHFFIDDYREQVLKEITSIIVDQITP